MLFTDYLHIQQAQVILPEFVCKSQCLVKELEERSFLFLPCELETKKTESVLSKVTQG
jgi:hypothetical protein